ncbi:restriction endonuclease [Kitasatospora purpeofusca]|uniref:Lsr2 family DNA-binding protein n=1 Tax=Kitasatospora purpeofusca TaxID=67352 RepID=UPI003697B2E7
MALTDDARYIIESGDDLYLIAVLHANIRFIGEALAALGDGLTHSELNDIAAREYGLMWTSRDQVRRRVYWLRAAGLVDVWSNGLIVPTNRGHEFLDRIKLVASEDLPHRRQNSTHLVDLPAPPALLSARLNQTDQAALRQRKRPVGYVAGGGRVEVLSRLVNTAVPEVTRRAFLDFCVEQFGVLESSAEQSLGALRSFGLLTQVGTDTFAATELAAECLASGEPLDFIRLLHLNIGLLGESLDAIEDTTHSSALVRVLAERYPQLPLTREDITRRVALFLETGLAERIGVSLRRTPLGTALVQTLPLLDRENSEEPPSNTTIQDGAGPRPEKTIGAGGESEARQLAVELVRAASDSADYRRFEKAVAAAFRTLGVEVEAHSGPKKTDVIVDVWRSPTIRLRVAVEAKTDGAGLITDQDVQFGRLGEHRKRHDAHCTVLVGPRFDARVKQEAGKDNVALLTAQELAQAVIRHSRTPLMPREIAALMTVEDRDSLEATWQAAERRQEVLSEVLCTMWKSGNDPVDIEYSAGALGVRDIWRETKGAVKTPFEPSEIEEALSFLRAPFIAGVLKHGSDHVVAAPPALVATRLRALARAVEAAGSEAEPDTQASPMPHDSSKPTWTEPPVGEPRTEAAVVGVNPSVVRNWARDQGRAVSARGRLPEGLVRDYKRAHGLLDK